MNVFSFTACLGREADCLHHSRSRRDRIEISYKGCSHTDHYWKNKIKRKYLQLYLNEFIYKLNRRYSGDKLFERLIIADITAL